LLILGLLLDLFDL